MTLAGNIAIVTGAAGGIGKGVALRVAADGAEVFCADLRDPSETVSEIKAKGGVAHPLTFDAGSVDGWANAMQSVSARGKVTLLANVAGVTPGAGGSQSDTVLNLEEREWDHIMDCNLKSVWLGMKSVIPHMQAMGRGRIVNTSSMAALRGMPRMAAYAATKGGIIALSQQAAAEFAKDNILINVIAPGMILTPAKFHDVPGFQAKAAQMQLISRLGEPSEVGAMVSFLFTEASFCTGQTFAIDGGWTIRA
jgi:NAD(P)-dependent dehydrogenase (short-subunit alcohol dehydrogenase family)